MRVLRGTYIYVLISLANLSAGCVSSIDQSFPSSLNIIVVDGTINNLVEPQIIRLNRSLSDPLTGKPGMLPITKATVEVIVDSAQVVSAHETTDGNYQLPNDFKGQIGHAYQLRFTLSDGTRYGSTQQIMPAVPSISQVRAQFNSTSLAQQEAIDGYFRAGHDFYLDTQDPVDQRNFYRWDWQLWESQDWCRSCVQGAYSINNVLTNYTFYGIRYFTAGDSLFENCFYPQNEAGQPPVPFVTYDYECRTQCWAILTSHDLNIFADSYTNGGLISAQKVARIPFYQHNPCLVEIRQSSLTATAYEYYKQVVDQTQHTGGVADAPPAILVGNVQNMANTRDVTVGFFTASAISTVRYWLDRKDTEGMPPGLFEALNGRLPHPEPSPPAVPQIQILDNSSRPRPYTAVCQSSDTQTPAKPLGWRN